MGSYFLKMLDLIDPSLLQLYSNIFLKFITLTKVINVKINIYLIKIHAIIITTNITGLKYKDNLQDYMMTKLNTSKIRNIGICDNINTIDIINDTDYRKFVVYNYCSSNYKHKLYLKLSKRS